MSTISCSRCFRDDCICPVWVTDGAIEIAPPPYHLCPEVNISTDSWAVLTNPIPNLQVKIKKLYPNAVLPTYAKSGDAGLDFTAIEGPDFVHNANGSCYYQYCTGLAIEIPEGYVGLIFPRSSISNKCLDLANCVGVIDSGYRGEIKFRFRAVPAMGSYESQDREYKAGDKIGQLIIMPYPQVELIEVDELSDSERGSDGFGSTSI